MTVQRILPNPHRPPSAYLYRTRDHARLRATGALNYLGRADRRIELGEIEGLLLELTAFRATPAQVHQTEAGAQNLVTYVEAAEVLAAWELLAGPLSGFAEATTPHQTAVLGKQLLTAIGLAMRISRDLDIDLELFALFHRPASAALAVFVLEEFELENV